MMGSICSIPDSLTVGDSSDKLFGFVVDELLHCTRLGVRKAHHVEPIAAPWSTCSQCEPTWHHIGWSSESGHPRGCESCNLTCQFCFLWGVRWAAKIARSSEFLGPSALDLLWLFGNSNIEHPQSSWTHLDMDACRTYRQIHLTGICPNQTPS